MFDTRTETTMHNQPSKLRRNLVACFALFTSAWLMPLAHADKPWPVKPIQLVIPYPPGGSADLLGRPLALQLQQQLGQPVVLEYKAGAGGTLATQYVARAQPDGYTVLMVLAAHAINHSLYPKLPYDTRKDFTPVAMMASNFLALVVRTDAPFKTTQELINYAKANPGKVTFGTNGEGAFLHFATEHLSQMAGYEYLHVPYKAISDVFTQMMGGEIHATMGSFISVQPLADSGKLRLLGIARATRSPDYPNVPTIAETLPGFASGGWFGMIAPAGLPKEIVTTLNKEINWALQQPDVRDRMKKLGLV